MHLERTGRTPHEVVEVYDTKVCTGCSGLLAYPHVAFGWRGCPCAGSDGHRTITCRDCGTVHYEPPHNPEVPRELGTGDYFNGP